MGSRMQLLGQFPGLLLGMEDMHMEKRVLRWRGVHWQPAEPINVGLGLPWTVTDSEVVLLQRCSADPVLIVLSHWSA